jgi:hypothetical protein
MQVKESPEAWRVAMVSSPYKSPLQTLAEVVHEKMVLLHR